MNRNSNTRFWVLTGFLTCQTLLGLGMSSAGEGPFPGSSPGSESGAGAQVDAGRGWGDVHGRLVTRLEDDLSSVSGTAHPGEFIGLEHAVIFARKVTRIHDAYSSNKVSHLPAGVLEARWEGLMPHVVCLRIGQPLVLRNRDSRPHVFLIRPSLEQETNLLMGPNEEQTVTFHLPHTAPLVVKCSLHEEQPAYVFATKHPYVAVSDASGEYILRDLPAGEPIELHVWHERARRRYGGQMVTSADWTAGRRVVVLPAGASLDLGESLIETIPLSKKRW